MIHRRQNDEAEQNPGFPNRFGNCNGCGLMCIYNRSPIRLVMAQTESKPATDPQPAVERSASEVIFASATEALGSAFFLWILGGVALSIAGGFAGDMIPSLPPGFDAQDSTGAHHSGHHSSWWHAVRDSAFVIFFAIFFIHSLWVGFREHGGGSRGRLQRILSNLREHWFGLIIGNAIGAWVAVLILGIMQDFSPWQMFWQWLWDLFRPIAEQIGHMLFEDATSSGLGAWISWYGANQSKLTFWFIYLCGAFDDLGVPNFKTLVRWAWRRRRRQKAMDFTTTVDRGDVY